MHKKRKNRFLKVLCYVLLLSLIGISSAAGIFITVTVLRSPSIDDLTEVSPKGYLSTVFDDEGKVVLNLSAESSNRIYAPLNTIPEDLQNAFVAIEDERFYEHHGVDGRGILRAIVKGIKSGELSQGASTITQQLIKNNVLTDWTSETTFSDRLTRKIQEQYLALRLETKVTKRWILENYLNTINLGGGNWGVTTAAKYYFNKDISELTLSECAVLAGITKNPTSYHPYKNAENNAKRRVQVLDKMLSLRYITTEEYEEALADDVYARIAMVRENGITEEVMTYFEDALILTLAEDLMEQKGCTEEEAWNLIYKGGLTIYSTENSRLQELCNAIAKDNEMFADETEVSMVMIDNATGQIKAMVGGSGEKEANLVLNRAVSVVRQPGSTIKVVGAYAAGLEDGDFTLATAVDDAPYTYTDGTSVSNADGNYHGMMTVEQAIQDSNNIVALKCFQSVGMDTVWQTLQKFGISTLSAKDKVEALALGGTSGGVTNLELTAAYSTIARGGDYLEPIYYTKVTDSDGNILLEKKQEVRQVISENTAKLLTTALEKTITEGTGSGAYFAGMSIAGKSGTTTQIRDAWFVGYSPYYTFGVWGGRDDNEAQESGGYVQAIWKEVMESAHSDMTDPGFQEDNGLVKSVICTKCGNLAVNGLCDETVQGDMTQTAYFVVGTEPTSGCSCHTAVTVCSETGLIANSYCKNTTKKIYLKEGTANTEDENYVIPANLKTSCCETHKEENSRKHFWSGWFFS